MEYADSAPGIWLLTTKDIARLIPSCIAWFREIKVAAPSAFL